MARDFSGVQVDGVCEREQAQKVADASLLDYQNMFGTASMETGEK